MFFMGLRGLRPEAKGLESVGVRVAKVPERGDWDAGILVHSGRVFPGRLAQSRP